ncbi:hypothetical protein RUM43_014106 [Polyplax serrata]|uniref:cyclin-dependent kinase n=1 Tax=Polyplax serrata TaxID=468196 RepID=A0AAN8PT10_POLSC
MDVVMQDESDTKGKEDDRLSFSLSEEDAEDTADSLDIKPPQAVTHRKPRHKKDKFSCRDSKRSHGHKEISSHRKSHRVSSSDRRRQHKENDRGYRDREIIYSREKEHREKRLSHRERRSQRDRSEHEHSKDPRLMRDHLYRVENKSDERVMQEKISFRELSLEDPQKANQLLQDLRGKLIDKRNIKEGKSLSSDRYDEPEKKKMKRERKDKDEREKPNDSPPCESARERSERLEREERKAKLLEADREMAKRKEVSRRELEARRERHNIEKEKDRMLKEIAKKHRFDQRRDRMTHDVVVVSDNSEETEESEGSTASTNSVTENFEYEEDEDDEDEDVDEDDDEDEDEDNEDDRTKKDDSDGVNDGTPESIPPLEKSPVPSDIEMEEGRKSGDVDQDEDEEKFQKLQNKPQEENVNENNASNEFPKIESIIEEDVLPPYLPAIQGCRSVEEFQCLNRIEEGTYGVVYRAKDKRTGDIVALKRLKMEKEKEGFPITSLREINTLLKAQHPNIVTVREIVVGSNMDKIFIVMDYVEHDLKSLMETMKQKKQVFVAGEIKCLMQQLLRAVAHLHDNWILHRDLKTSNLLLSHKGVLKVGDFGLAREYGSPLKIYTPIVVTLWYRAPELLLQSKEYTTSIDMWSVGCIFGELLQMEALFSGRSDMDQLTKIFKELGTPNEKIWPGYSKLPAIQKVAFPEYPINQLRSRFGTMLSELGIDLINRFLTYDPGQRITAEDALKHDFFKEAPLPIDPAMFPTWPAKSEQGHKKVNNSPKPPSGGKEYKQLGDTDEDVSASGFHMGVVERRVSAIGPGFSLKF